MWCKRCQQDVAGFAASVGSPVACGRCGLALSASSGPDESGPWIERAHPSDHGIDLSSDHGLPLEMDDWDLDDDLHIPSPPGKWASAAQSPLPSWAGMPPAARQGAPSNARTTELVFHKRSQDRIAPRARGNFSWIAWTVLLMALMTFVCGAVLLIWSAVAARAELWALGLPICGAGQIGLIVGLVLQLERVWQNSHWTAGKLEQVDEQLSDLKNSASLLQTTHSGPGVSFYAHMAEGASPQLLLADLKGQLDLLALRMAETHR